MLAGSQTQMVWIPLSSIAQISSMDWSHPRRQLACFLLILKTNYPTNKLTHKPNILLKDQHVPENPHLQQYPYQGHPPILNTYHIALDYNIPPNYIVHIVHHYGHYTHHTHGVSIVNTKTTHLYATNTSNIVVSLSCCKTCFVIQAHSQYNYYWGTVRTHSICIISTKTLNVLLHQGSLDCQ